MHELDALHPFSLSLADGSRLALSGDGGAAPIVDFLAQAACLSRRPAGPGARRIHVLDGSSAGEVAAQEADIVLPLDAIAPAPPPWARVPPGDEGPIDDFRPVPGNKQMWRRLARLSAAISREVQPAGGCLLHTALATLDGPVLAGEALPAASVLLAGRSGVGKSTACARLSPPWRAVADDMALIVKARDGSSSPSGYLAHPWPTWSRFFGEEVHDPAACWPVEQATPLVALFFIEQSAQDAVEPMGPGEAVCRLTSLAGDATTHLLRGWDLADITAFHAQRFENLCGLVKAVPAFRLRVLLGGRFWERMEEALGAIRVDLGPANASGQASNPT